MSFSSGVFSLASGNPVTTGTTISSTWANNTLSDIATGLSTCVLKDGTQTITASLPMSGFILTGLGAGTVAGNSLRYEQLVGVYLPLAGGTLTGNLLFTDATYDIGASGATRPRDLFLSRNAVIGGTINVTGHTTFEGVTSTGATGSGKLVYDTSPTIATAALGSSTATTQTAGDNSTKLATTAYVDTGKPGLQTSVATTSGTAVTISNAIPSWAKRLTLSLSGVSTSGTSPVIVQVGTGGVATTSGYTGSAFGGVNAGTPGATNPSDGFAIKEDSAAGYTRYGILTLQKHTGNQWVASGCGGQEDSARYWGCGGDISLAGALDFMRITTQGGTDTFDAGSVALMWE